MTTIKSLLTRLLLNAPIIDQDTFTRANVSSGWGTATGSPLGSVWTLSRGTAFFSISGNKALARVNGSAYSVMTLGTNLLANFDIYTNYTPAATGDSGGPAGRFVDSSHFYYGDIGNLGQFAEIGKNVGGTFTTVASVAFAWSVGTTYTMRFRGIGSSLQLKVWVKGTAEPASWTVSGTDSSITAAGNYGIGCHPSSSTNQTYDTFIVNKTIASPNVKMRFVLTNNVIRTVGVRLKLLSHTPTLFFSNRLRLAVSRTRTLGARFSLVARNAQSTGIRFILSNTSTLGQDTFQRNSQTGMGFATDGQRWLTFGTVTTAITANEGVFTNSAGYTGATLGTHVAADLSIQVRLAQDNVNHGCGVCFRFQDPNNYYLVYYYQSQLFFAAIVAGQYHTIALASFSASVGSFIQLQVFMTGNHLQAVAWPYGTAQPTQAILDTTDSLFPSAGQFGLAVNAFSTGIGPKFDSFLATTNPGSLLAPTNGTGSETLLFWNGVGKSQNVPQLLPIISRGCPAYTNDNDGGAYPASNAVDGDYSTLWRSAATPTAAAPIYLALDLSAVPASQLGQVLLQWINDPQTGAWDASVISVNYFNTPKAYTIDVNAAPGGTLPTTGWVTVASETNNPYHSRMYPINMTGYNWVRINITDINGSSLNMSAALNLDVYNAVNGLQDVWAFGGDSITQQGALHDNTSGGTFAQLVNGYGVPFFPAFDSWGIGGLTSTDGWNHWLTWLATFPGRYVSINYGTNDANQGGPFLTTYQSNMTNMVQAVLNAGKIPIVPTIPWGGTTNLLANVPTLNAIIQNLYKTFPSIIKGPDMYAYYSANQALIGSDGIHPTRFTGYSSWRQLWVNAMLSNVYTAAAPPPVAPPTAWTGRFSGYGVLPLLTPPVLPYTVNGTPLDVQPTLMTAPVSTGAMIAAGVSFVLGFSNPSAMVQNVFASGSIVTLQFGLSDGSSRTAQVSVQSQFAGSFFQVTCTLMQNSSAYSWVLPIQAS